MCKFLRLAALYHSSLLTNLSMVFEYSGVVLEKVCEYFLYNVRNRGQENVPDMDLPVEMCLELLMAADYLDGESPIFF